MVKKTGFSIDGGPTYVGYTQGLRWNGWERPCFTKEVSALIFKDLVEAGGTEATFVADLDAFRLPNDEEGMNDVFEGFDITVDRMTIHVYEIGNGWIWDEDEPVKVFKTDHKDFFGTISAMEADACYINTSKLELASLEDLNKSLVDTDDYGYRGLIEIKEGWYCFNFETGKYEDKTI